MTPVWIYLCFFLSGFSGLVYEVVWSRLFVYTMGSSHLSIAVVVSVFMAGLALGSALGGRLADRVASPLRLYGWLVIGAGVLSVAVIPEINLLEPLLRAVYRLHDGEPGHLLFTLVKVAVCSITILLPTTFMGATLPVLVRHLSRSLGEVGSRIGALYAVNCLGAVAGTLAAGFFLIPRIGLGWSLLLAGAVDVAAGLLALFMSAPAPAGPGLAREAKTAKPKAVEVSPVPFAVRVAVLAFGVSGFANMCLQLGWTRALVVSIGNSTYSFSIILGIFIFGLAAGGWLAGLFADRLHHPMAAFGWLLIATACAASITIPWLGFSPARFAWQLGQLSRAGQFNFDAFLSASAWQVAWMILPATVLMGMAFPIVGKLRALSPPAIGRSVGLAYAANTTGAILGTAVTGFILMPLLGRIWALLYLAVGISLAAGLAVLLAAPSLPHSVPPGGRSERRLRRFALLGAVLALLAVSGYITRPFELMGGEPGNQLPGKILPTSQFIWNPVILSQGAYANVVTASPFSSPEEYASEQIRSWKPLYYRDGIDSSVGVMENFTGMVTMNISGKVHASSWKYFNFDLQTQLLMGHLPLLIHPAPSDVLSIGLGCGMSLGAVTVHSPVKEIDLVEISQEVVDAARLHFGQANKNSLANPRVKVIIGDGRNHLAHTAKTYDVISSEPSYFWIAGLGNLFTQEYYRLLAERLKPGGILCQWIYGYYIREPDYKLALRTILETFPHVTVWSNSFGDTIILAAREPIVLDRDRIAQALSEPAVQADLEPIGITAPEYLMRYFCAEGKMLLDWIGKGEINRDLFPILEFRSPRGFFGEYTHNLPAMAEAGKAPISPGILRNFSQEQSVAVESFRQIGRALVRCVNLATISRFDEAIEEYKGLARSGDPWSIACAGGEFARRVKNIGDLKKRLDLLGRIRQAKDTPELQEAYRIARGAAPAEKWEEPLEAAMAKLQANLPAEALGMLEAAGRLKAPAHKIAHLKGVALGMQGDLQAAIVSLRDAYDRWPAGSDPERGEVSYNLAYCFERMNRFGEAAEAYRRAMNLGYPASQAGIPLARSLRLAGKPDEAVKEAVGALKAAQTSGTQVGEAMAELGRAHESGGNLVEALRWMEEAARAVPGRFDEELERLRQRR